MLSLSKSHPRKGSVGDMAIPQISHEDFGKFVVAFYHGDYDDWARSRFGQAFFYHFKDQGMDSVKDPELFYTRDIEEATRLINERYLAP